MIRRRNYFIKKRFQLKFALSFVLLLVLEAALVISLFMRVSTDTVTTGYLDSVLRVESTPSFFFVPFLLILMITGVGICAAAMIIFILLSHRIAGPLYRFEKDLEEIGFGDLTKRIALRNSDQLTELKEALNVLVESLDQRVGKIKESTEELRQLISKKDDPASAEKILKVMETLRNEIEHFKVSS
ncbi:MAG: methyl-accepting chemotaxis protein [Candidatus Omnitrophota bacterium]